MDCGCGGKVESWALPTTKDKPARYVWTCSACLRRMEKPVGVDVAAAEEEFFERVAIQMEGR